MMVFTKCALVLVMFTLAPHVLGQTESADQVECYSTADPECSGAPDLETSPRECCLGVGYWYRLGPSGECVRCIVFGWLDGTDITLNESTGTYTLQAGFIKGGAVQKFVTSHNLARFQIEIIERGAVEGVNEDFAVQDNTHSLFGQDPDPFNVPIIVRLDGVALEPAEEFVLSLVPTNPTAMAVLAEGMPGLIAIPEISVVIQDFEYVSLQFTEIDYSRIESERFIQPQLQLSTTIATDLIVEVIPLNLTYARNRMLLPESLDPALTDPNFDPDTQTATSVDDFSIMPVQVTFTSANSPETIEFDMEIIDDTIHENDQTFVLGLEVVHGGNRDRLLSQRTDGLTTLGRIIDDDTIVIGFEQEQYTVFEEFNATGDPIPIPVIKGNNLQSELQFDVIAQFSDGTAQQLTGDATGDYSTINSRITIPFPAVEQFIQVEFLLINDRLPEDTEDFSIELTSSGAPRVTIGEVGSPFSRASVFIIDDDVLTIGWEQNVTTVSETQGPLELCLIIRDVTEFDILTGFSVMLFIGTVRGTAADPDDYTALRADSAFVFVTGELPRRGCITVMINNDTLPEEVEFFSIQVVPGPDGLSPNIKLEPDLTFVEINDYLLIVRIEQKAYNVSEADGSVEVCAILVRGVPIGPTRVTLTTVDGGATASKDYSSKAEDLVLDSAITKSCVVIPIVNDVVPEFAEDFTIRLTVNDDRTGTATEVAIVTISDDDEPEEGCSIEVLVLTETQERNQKDVVEDVVTVFPTILTNTTNLEPTSGEELFVSVYSSLAEDFGRVESDTGYTDFVEAVTEITEAHQEACSGPPDERPTSDDVPDLVQRFVTITLSEAEELRRIFGKMLCIKNSEDTTSARRKRQVPVDVCVCPVGGFDDVFEACEFFACLDKDIEDGVRLEVVFGFLDVVSPLPCLGFVVDTTGSMADEIRAVQNLILSFVSSEQDEPACYVITPFNDWHGYTDRGEIPPGPDYGPATVYNTEYVTDLLNMLDNVLALTANGGGDCEEYGMNGIQETFNSKDLRYRLDTMTEGSQMILITDAFAKDASLADAIITEARRRKVCIHLLLSTSGCGGDFSSYVRVATETGGRVVRGTSDEFNTLIGVFGEFSTSYQDSPCNEFYRSGRRKKRQTLATGRCHTFKVSTFTNILKFLITTEQSEATVQKPSGERVTINIVGGYGAYREVGPQPGEWSVCVASGTLTVSFNNRVLLDFVVTFVKEDESLPGHLTATSVPPPACSSGEVAVVSSRVPDISLASLNFIRDGSVIGSVPLTLCGGAMVGNGTFPQGSVTYQLQGEDVGGNPFEISRKSVGLKPGKYSFRALSDPVEIDSGESTIFTFRLHNQNSYGFTNFTLTTESTSGIHVVLQQTHTSLKAKESTDVSTRVTAGSRSGSNQVTIIANDGCTRVTASQSLLITAPEIPTAPPDVCGCENGGTCITIIRRGREFNTCQCPPGYGGRRCEI